ncbi:MAG: hypothetical protein COA78_11655 [Blastopirellula sp.]|nr:MAG: hypothetical protein COA78_11655 [Blastopirellula sp.]
MTYVIDFPTSLPVATPETEITYPTSTFAPTAELITEPVYQPQNYYPTNTSNSSLSRDHIRSMDILNRPYRPGHFYGNTVRRRHHRGR